MCIRDRYKLINPQKKVLADEVQPFIELINREHKETQQLTIVKILKRVFEETVSRVVVIYRYEDFTVQYVLIEDQEGIRIVESEPFELGLPKLNEKVEKEIKEQQVIETQVETQINKEEEQEDEQAEEIR